MNLLKVSFYFYDECLRGLVTVLLVANVYGVSGDLYILLDNQSIAC